MGRRVKTRSDFRAAMSLLAQNACSDIMEEDSLSSSAISGGGLQMRRLNNSVNSYQPVKQHEDSIPVEVTKDQRTGTELLEAEPEEIAQKSTTENRLTRQQKVDLEEVTIYILRMYLIRNHIGFCFREPRLNQRPR